VTRQRLGQYSTARAPRRRRRREIRLWGLLGAGLIAGASDDDPSGIGTYSQAGATFGYALGWTLLFSYPLMVAIQGICARIGRTSGRGIAGNLREHYPNWVLQTTVALLFIANTLNIGADLGAMAAATRLLLPQTPGWIWIALFGVLCTAPQIILNHRRYVGVLKWLTLALFSYFASLLAIHVPWSSVVEGVLVPHAVLRSSFWLMVVAILGTTISPYLFFWQAGQEVEDTKADAARVALRRRPQQGRSALRRIRIDTLIGMGISNLVALAILVTTAATLQPAGIHEISTAAQAAEALRPIAGEMAFALFALGIIGTGLLAVPVLAGSAAYAIGEARRWPVGFSRRPLRAKAFYATIAAATLLGAIENVSRLNPVSALVWAAVINAVVAVPMMVLLMRMGSNPEIMGGFGISGWWRWLGWCATGVMAVAVCAMLLSTWLGGQQSP
jgi:NRAMP (natural resistance-associated macrophage protein)-like metal ion transporter